MSSASVRDKHLSGRHMPVRLKRPGVGRLMRAVGRTAKNVVTPMARQMGFEVIRPTEAALLSLAVHLRAVFEIVGVDCVFDVGANRGQYHDFLRNSVGYAGPIVSFEPIPELANILGRRVTSDPLWEIHAAALGPLDGECSFNVMTDETYSSFLSPSDRATSRCAAQNTITRTQSVTTRRLDGLAAESAFGRRARRLYLKLDTQGYDLQVLQGAQATLARVGALQTELSVLPLYDGMPDYMAAIRCLNQLGFDLSGMFHVLADERLRMIEFDGVFVRRE